MDESESVIVKLTRMEGKLDLSNPRHDQTDVWKATVDSRLKGHGERIGGLETREHGRDGERRGADRTMNWMMKLIPVVGGGGVVGVVALIARHFQL